RAELRPACRPVRPGQQPLRHERLAARRGRRADPGFARPDADPGALGPGSLDDRPWFRAHARRALRMVARLWRVQFLGRTGFVGPPARIAPRRPVAEGQPALERRPW